MSDTATIILIFVLYMAFMVGIGVFFWLKDKKKKSADTYLLAGRTLNPWVSAMSAQASDMSGWLLTGLPGMAFAIGVSVVSAQEAVWTAIGLLIGTMTNWLVTARRLRVYTEVAGNSQTLPEYFQNRFNDKRGILRAISALIILVFFTVYSASMFSAGAKLFNSIFGLDYNIALIVGAAVIVCYVFMGGFLAVSYTDLIQGLLMFFVLITVPFFMFGSLNDSQAAELSGVFGAIGHLFPDGSNDISWMVIFSSIGWGLGYFGMPHILVRFMATKDQRTIKPATVIAGIWCVLTLAAAVLIGIVATQVLKGVQIADNEQVFIEVVKKLFSPVVAGIMLSAVLAAIMSTADSQLLVASTAFANDFYKVVFRKKASEKEVLWVSRITILVVSVLAVLIALDSDSSIFELVSYAWAGFGAAFGPVVLFSLYNKNLTLKGAAASMVTGALVTVVFKYGLSRLGGFWAQIYEIVPGFILAAAVLFIVSALDKKKDPAIIRDFERMLEVLRGGSGKKEVITDGADNQYVLIEETCDAEAECNTEVCVNCEEDVKGEDVSGPDGSEDKGNSI